MAVCCCKAACHNLLALLSLCINEQCTIMLSPTPPPSCCAELCVCRWAHQTWCMPSLRQLTWPWMYPPVVRCSILRFTFLTTFRISRCICDAVVSCSSRLLRQQLRVHPAACPPPLILAGSRLCEYSMLSLPSWQHFGSTGPEYGSVHHQAGSQPASPASCHLAAPVLLPWWSVNRSDLPWKRPPPLLCAGICGQ
jgi:hypothetical protein